MTDIEKLEGYEYVREINYRHDINNLTPKEVLDTLLHTIDKDTTVEMIEENIVHAIMAIDNIKFDRICKILDIKYSWDFIEDQKRKECNTVEVKT